MKKFVLAIATAIVNAQNPTSSKPQPAKNEHQFTLGKMSFKFTQLTMTLLILAGLILSVLLIWTGTADTVLVNLSSR